MVLNRRGARSLWWGLLLFLWLLQLAWLTWHFTPDGVDLAQRLGDKGSGAVRREDTLAKWLAELARLIPPDRTYIYVDCYETGDYTRLRYFLYPRRQVRLDPKTTPALLFTTIKEEGATFILLGGCNLDPHWQFLLKSDQRVFQTIFATGPGLVFGVDPNRLVGGFYD